MSRDNADRMIASVPTARIRVGERSRALCEEAVVSLVESIKTIGLQTPISVLIDPASRDEHYLLVAGLHRVEACRRLGMAYIDARIVDLDETERRLWEIAENLHRAELTTLERSEHVDLWIKLSHERAETKAQIEYSPKVAQVAPPGGRQPHDQGINAAVRELGIDRTEAQRSVRIAGLAPEAKAEARALGLDDTQSTLLKAAKAPSKEAQIRALREAAARKVASRDGSGASEARVEAAINLVKRLSEDELGTFAVWFDGFRAERGNADAKPSAQPRWTMRI